MTVEEIHAAALARAFAANSPIDPLPDVVVADDAQAAAMQGAAITSLGAAVVGWKIGATSAKAQAIMRASGPFYGPVFADRLWNDGAEIALPPGFRGFECEFALRLGADLPGRENGYRADQLAIAIDAVVPVIELVATRQRVEGMGDARRAWADFGFNHGLVLGAPVMPPPLDALATAAVVARVDDVEVGRGCGADVLGHPIEALAWLTRQGIALSAGHIVSTGTCTGLGALGPGQAASGDFGDFGEVTVRAA